MEAQIIEALSDLDYHSSPALSASGAKLILKSPAHYRWAMDHLADVQPGPRGPLARARLRASGGHA